MQNMTRTASKEESFITMNSQVKGRILWMLAVCTGVMSLQQWLLFTTVIPVHENGMLVAGRRSMMSFQHDDDELTRHDDSLSLLRSPLVYYNSMCGPKEGRRPWYEAARGRRILQTTYEEAPPTMRHSRTDDLFQMMLRGLLEEAAERKERLVTLSLGQNTGMSSNINNTSSTSIAFMGLQLEDENRQWWLPITVMNSASYHQRQGKASLRGGSETATTTTTTATTSDACSHVVLPWTLRSTQVACSRLDGVACGTVTHMLERILTVTDEDSAKEEEWKKKNQRQRSYSAPVVWDMDTMATVQLPLVLEGLVQPFQPALIRFQVPSPQPDGATSDGDTQDNGMFLKDLRKTLKKAGYFVLPLATTTTEGVDTFLALQILGEDV
eukprot:scaffold2682_cov155-Amphora_coffeaeformis.AAC.6